MGSVAYLASAPVKTTVNNIRAFDDGDKVFLQTVYNFAGAGEQVAFDIFRFDEEGLIAEHWNNLTAQAESNPSGHTQIDGTLEKKDVDREETRRIVAVLVSSRSHIPFGRLFRCQGSRSPHLLWTKECQNTTL